MSTEYNTIKQNVYCVTAITDCTVTSEGITLATVSAGTQALIVAIDEVTTIEGDCVLTPVI